MIFPSLTMIPSLWTVEDRLHQPVAILLDPEGLNEPGRKPGTRADEPEAHGRLLDVGSEGIPTDSVMGL